MTYVTITLWGDFITVETMTRELRAVLIVIRELDRMLRPELVEGREGLWERVLWVRG